MEIVRTGDHPRACGAHSYVVHGSNGMEGSSPRMRGSQGILDEHKVQWGIIPAHAGLTSHHHMERPACRDHPRACGAHAQCRRGSGTNPGSSPRMRGSPIGAKDRPWEEGIIPAHAGLTARKSRRFTIRRDHPRACGAHLNTPAFAWLFQGSSPRMRGSHRGKDKSLVRAGIIPAHAGLT